MEANFGYTASDRIGYGRMGIELAKALELEGVKLLGIPSEAKPTGVASWVAFPTHARGWYQGQYASVFTMWETTRLPEAFRANIHEFDLVMVPSEQNLELFSQYHPNVVKIPLGFDPVAWQYRPRTVPDQEFVFLISGGADRKGVDLAVKAYRNLWSEPGSWHGGPTPTLWIKSKSGRALDRENNEIELIRDRMHIIPGELSPAEEIDLYGMAHCYVQPSRAEGFGLQPLQAIAEGLPTILTDAHGHAEYAYLGMGISAKPSKAGYFAMGYAGDWWEPDIDVLTEHMRFIYENYEEACFDAEFSSEAAHDSWTWAETAALWIDRHHPHLDGYTGNGGWHEPEQLLYPIKTTRYWAPNIGGTQYEFRPGETYYALGDVKTLAYEQPQLLHPDSFNDPGGLTESQLDTLDERRATTAYCPSCGQRLNSGKTKADDIFERREAELLHEDDPLPLRSTSRVIPAWEQELREQHR